MVWLWTVDACSPETPRKPFWLEQPICPNVNSSRWLHEVEELVLLIMLSNVFLLCFLSSALSKVTSAATVDPPQQMCETMKGSLIKKQVNKVHSG